MEKTDEQEKATNFALKYLEHLIEKELDASESTPRPLHRQGRSQEEKSNEKIGWLWKSKLMSRPDVR